MAAKADLSGEEQRGTAAVVGQSYNDKEALPALRSMMCDVPVPLFGKPDCSEPQTLIRVSDIRPTACRADDASIRN